MTYMHIIHGGMHITSWPLPLLPSPRYRLVTVYVYLYPFMQRDSFSFSLEAASESLSPKGAQLSLQLCWKLRAASVDVGTPDSASSYLCCHTQHFLRRRSLGLTSEARQW